MNFLFDIGRVLLDFDFVASLSKLLPAEVDRPRERLELLLERKDELESGRIDPEDYVAWALGVMGSTASHEEFRRAWCDIFTPNEPMWQRVRQLKADGHKLVLFSNINAIHVPWIYEAHPQFKLFDGAVMSFEVGLIKPQPGIYAHAIEEHAMTPSETLYIDDMPENIAAGRAAGFRSWRYEIHNHAAFEQWLDKTLQQPSIVSP